MPRTAITPYTLKSAYAGPPAADALDCSYDDPDVGNGNYVAGEAVQIFDFNNTGASPYTFTIKGVPDEYGRDADIGPYTVPAGEQHAIVVPGKHYKTAAGQIEFDVENVALKVRVLRLP